QVGDRPALLSGEIAKPRVEPFFEIKLGANHVMYIHRRPSPRQGSGRRRLCVKRVVRGSGRVYSAFRECGEHKTEVRIRIRIETEVEMSKNALITGAGSGIGFAIAVALMGRRWNLAVCGRKEAKIVRSAAR